MVMQHMWLTQDTHAYARSLGIFWFVTVTESVRLHMFLFKFPFDNWSTPCTREKEVRKGGMEEMDCGFMCNNAGQW